MPKKIKLNGPVIGDGSTWLYDWFGMPYISASKLSKELDSAGGDDVELYINSGGGSVFAGSEVYTVLKEYSGKVTAKITGVAASAASFLAMGADEVKMSPTSQMMIHNAATWTDGDKNVHYSNGNMLSSVDVGITNAYRLKTGRTMDDLLDLMNKTTWMNAQQAVEFGFADGILFDDENALIAVTNSISGEIPPDVESKLRDILVSAMFKGGAKSDSDKPNPFDGLDLSSIMPQVSNSLENGDGQQENAEPQTKEEDSPMDLNELKAKHPDLYNEIINLGVTQERNRITELNALAGAPGAAEIVAKAIEDGKTAGETAMEIVKASKERISDEAKRRHNDALNSGIDKVDPDEAPATPNPEAASQAEAEALAEEINNLIGGRK
ncbi:head maturation protease, ClpP-related [Paenibacillus glucanolyticus]|uniref:head maturation protease, ClpP-related n=1 Tax=Paenibacillus glucanolyticus TaxID=59843 RepID=UPI00128AF10E|nr:head maturation protease, ClpP-related [Paenibacillus glucanolyticus]MPY20633.1 Clp protease ClpP [Paenibacillus glucanolyticus]